MISELASRRIFLVEFVLLAVPSLLFGVVEAAAMAFSPVVNFLASHPDQPLHGIPVITAGVLGLVGCGGALHLIVSFLTGGATKLKRTLWLWWAVIAVAFVVAAFALSEVMGGFGGIVHGTSLGGLIMIAAMSGLLGVIPYLHLLAERLFRPNDNVQI